MIIHITLHAEEQIVLRKLTRELVVRVVTAPEQIIPAKGNRYFAQSRFVKDGKEYLLRVLVETSGSERFIVTVYPTSKISKYWQGSER